MYPKTLLTRPIRITIMFFLILSFFVISPLIIFYTAGYRYDLKSGVVRETGVLSVDIKPDDASVFLDGVRLDRRIPIRLTDLIPATYRLLIQKEGYLSWERDVVVGNKQTTYIRDVTLFKDTQPLLFLDIEQTIVDMSASYDGLYMLIVTKQDDMYEVLLVDTNTEEMTTILKSEAFEKPIVEWSPFMHNALIQIYKEGQSRTHIFSAEDPKMIQSYTHKNSLQKHQWKDRSDEPLLFIQDQGTIKIIGANREDTLAKTTSIIWYIDENTNLWIAHQDKKELEYIPFTKNPKTYQVDYKLEDIIAVQNNYIIVKTNNEIKIVIRDGNELKEIHSLPTQSIRYNHATDEWIAWSPWEIWNIYEDGSAAFLNRTSEQIGDVIPLDEFGVLLLTREASLTGFNPGYFVDHTLLDNTNIRIATVRVDKRIIFFWGDVENQTGIWKLPY